MEQQQNNHQADQPAATPDQTISAGAESSPQSVPAEHAEAQSAPADHAEALSASGQASPMSQASPQSQDRDVIADASASQAHDGSATSVAAQPGNAAVPAHSSDQSAAAGSRSSGWEDVDNDDYGVPARKISYEEALELSRRQPGLSSIIFMVQVSIFCMFASAFAGFAKASSLMKEMAGVSAAPSAAGGVGAAADEAVALDAADSVGAAAEAASEADAAGLVDVPDLDAVGDAVSAAGVAADSSELASRMAELAGPLCDMGAMGAGLWFLLSSLCGCLAVIIPSAVYNAIARSPDRSHGQHAGMTMYDVIKAEILKYSIMVIILVAAFKFTELNALVIMSSFVIVMFVQIIKTSLSLGLRR